MDLIKEDDYQDLVKTRITQRKKEIQKNLSKLKVNKKIINSISKTQKINRKKSVSKKIKRKEKTDLNKPSCSYLSPAISLKSPRLDSPTKSTYPMCAVLASPSVNHKKPNLITNEIAKRKKILKNLREELQDRGIKITPSNAAKPSNSGWSDMPKLSLDSLTTFKDDSQDKLVFHPSTIIKNNYSDFRNLTTRSSNTSFEDKREVKWNRKSPGKSQKNNPIFVLSTTRLYKKAWLLGGANNY